jgi:hypothetical protein
MFALFCNHYVKSYSTKFFLLVSYNFTNLLLQLVLHWQTEASRFEKVATSTDNRDATNRHKSQLKSRHMSACSMPTQWRHSRKQCRHSSVTNDRRQHRRRESRQTIRKPKCFPSRVTNFRQNNRHRPASEPWRKKCRCRVTLVTKSFGIDSIGRWVLDLKNRLNLLFLKYSNAKFKNRFID